MAGSQLHQYFIVGNILLFVPFGIAVAYAFPSARRKWWSVTLVGLLVSVIIEGVQYFGHLGLCEFDDVFHNTVGMVVGYGMAKVMLWLHNRLREYRKSSGESA